MTVLVTGATGFVGVRLLPRLTARGHRVVTYGRRAPETSTPHRAVIGDITDAAQLTTAMAGVDVVLHLAATTGKAAPADHQRTIVDGTRAVVDACRRAGVPRLVAVSSIAAGFADLRDYPYGRAKREAEEVVRASGVRAVLVRPTAIFGAGSPVQRGLAGLAGAPIVPVIGPGTTPLQPIHVDDVADALTDLVDDTSVDGETIDLGGPEAVAVAPLLHRMRRAAGRPPARTVWLPAPLVIWPLRLAEALGLGAVLPVSAGQFSSFVHSGAARPHAWTAARQARLRALDTTLAPEPAPVGMAAAARRERAVVDRAALSAECRVFTRHLLGVDPAAAVVDAYVAAHERAPHYAAETAFDVRLVTVAVRHPLLARLADAYGRLLAPTGLLRRKLVLLLAILETTPPHYRAVDAPLAGGLVTTVGALAFQGVVAGAGAVLALLVFAPIHLASRGAGPR